MWHPKLQFNNCKREVIPINIGQNIRTLRQKHKLTQKELARKLNVTEAAISRWENGVCYPDITMLPSIAHLLETSIDSLFSYESNIPMKKAIYLKSSNSNVFVLEKVE